MSGLLCAGNVRFARKISDGVYDDYLDLGNTEKFALKADSENKIRTSTDPDSYGEALDSVNIPKPTSLTIATNEFDSEVMALLFRGGVSDMNVAAGTGVSETFTVRLGLYRRLAKSNLQAGVVVKHDAGATATTWAATTAKIVGACVVPTVANGHYYKCTIAGTTDSSQPTWPTTGGTVADGTATWLDMGTIILAASDVTIDYRIGMVMPKAGGAAVEGETLQVTYDHAAIAGKQVAGGTKLPAVGRVLFFGVNLADASKVQVEIPEIVLTPNGETDLMANNFSAMSLEGNPKKLPTETASFYITSLKG